ncbi:hypothetical protein EI94DRAFT_1708388 [Lactarius quietus]|nr:hypothetical protein EI94DRAFT_1708388 [Lactarius quietus]
MPLFKTDAHFKIRDHASDVRWCSNRHTALRDAPTSLLHNDATVERANPSTQGRISATDPSEQADGFFMLEAVYLAWSLRERRVENTCAKRASTACLRAGLCLYFYSSVVVCPMRRRANYATGLTATVRIPPSVCTVDFDCTCADVDTHTSGRSCGDNAATTSPSKRRYVLDAVEVGKKIRQDEVDFRDHNTVLRGIKNNTKTHPHVAFAQDVYRSRAGTVSIVKASSDVNTPHGLMYHPTFRKSIPV